MAKTGPLNHIDISVGYPEKSVPFYGALLEALGYERQSFDLHEPGDLLPQRAVWEFTYADGSTFAIEVLSAHEDVRDIKHNRYRPGTHHMAFHAASRAVVEDIHSTMVDLGAKVLDPPFDYSDRPAYGPGYYAVFFADPDGQMVEVVYDPATNP